MRKQKGFSLIELLIVVAIILIIAAIAIPNLMRARMSANESSAAAGVRTISTAQVTYFTTYQKGYADTLVKLGTPAAGCTAPTIAGSCLIDSVVTIADTTAKSGYLYAVTGLNADGNGYFQGFLTSAAAQTWNRTGLRSFCSIEDNVVHTHVETATVVPITTPATCIGWDALNN
jgi:prepilin-type N-terminal cleavage/methylation domain-containing protein